MRDFRGWKSQTGSGMVTGRAWGRGNSVGSISECCNMKTVLERACTAMCNVHVTSW